MLVIYFIKGDLAMFKLNVTNWNVYYLHNYIPNDDRKTANLNDRRISHKILRYKHEGKSEFRLFTRELMKSISYLSNYIINEKYKKIELVSIPPSKVDKFSPIQESINQISKWYECGKTFKDFNCYNELLNNNILSRFSDVNSAHNEGPRPEYNDHINSILFNNDYICSEDTAFILIDDITTTGTIMCACEDILIKNDINKDSIYKFAICKTVHDND